jgi:S-adenosylmethionine:diacylglycerol 3-amino-3-carboxypropyl transferase
MNARRPLYAADNEDSRSELRALAPAPGDLLVCVAAGGGRALSLLGAGAARLVAVDRRPEQLHGLEIKAAALDALSYPVLRGFLGLDASDERLDAYADLRGSLSPAARRYWDARRGLVREGVLYAGRLETWLARCAALLRRGGWLRWPAAAFAARSLAEQRALLLARAAEVSGGERGFALLMHPAVAWLAMRDPSFLRSTEGNPGRCLYRRLVAWADRHLLRESFLLALIWTGRYDPTGALPPWLTREGSERARKHLGSLSLTCADLAALPGRLPPAPRVHWSLSDVSCWMGERRFHALLAAIAAASPPGSRVCFRNLAAVRGLPPATPGRPALATLPRLTAAIDAEDASVFYRLHAAEVR